MKLLLLIFAIIQLQCVKLTFAQKFSKDDYVKNHIFFELGGNGFLYSFNFERMVTKNFVLRAGFGYWFGVNAGLGTPSGTFYSVPITTSYLIGEEHSKLELGLGAAFFSAEDATIFFVNLGDQSNLVVTTIIGYRGSSRDGGFVFRIAFTPFYQFGSDFKFYPYAGVSFGHSF